jgi:hypothetical protein
MTSVTRVAHYNLVGHSVRLARVNYTRYTSAHTIVNEDLIFIGVMVVSYRGRFKTSLELGISAARE